MKHFDISEKVSHNEIEETHISRIGSTKALRQKLTWLEVMGGQRRLDRWPLQYDGKELDQ